MTAKNSSRQAESLTIRIALAWVLAQDSTAEPRRPFDTRRSSARNDETSALARRMHPSPL
jgi:hypothetical protein